MIVHELLDSYYHSLISHEQGVEDCCSRRCLDNNRLDHLSEAEKATYNERLVLHVQGQTNLDTSFLSRVNLQVEKLRKLNRKRHYKALRSIKKSVNHLKETFKSWQWAKQHDIGLVRDFGIRPGLKSTVRRIRDIEFFPYEIDAIHDQIKNPTYIYRIQMDAFLLLPVSEAEHAQLQDKISKQPCYLEDHNLLMPEIQKQALKKLAKTLNMLPAGDSRLKLRQLETALELLGGESSGSEDDDYDGSILGVKGNKRYPHGDRFTGKPRLINLQ
ncbi:uncharacterized protein KY384_003967 [Bacidia gigantensis]|uniref:uncharacterized protein n=1 Tax=Bacidia gigantensis TaxID=2732470 RepID=UPI001D04DACA|nr:uncharacterized protein KY384_003967 [Bacidia gigantensis]KAG8532326.1 hypothetical protein KY384_003967 [Bacidia gigantensis]